MIALHPSFDISMIIPTNFSYLLCGSKYKTLSHRCHKICHKSCIKHKKLLRLSKYSTKQAMREGFRCNLFIIFTECKVQYLYMQFGSITFTLHHIPLQYLYTQYGSQWRIQTRATRVEPWSDFSLDQPLAALQYTFYIYMNVVYKKVVLDWSKSYESSVLHF